MFNEKLSALMKSRDISAYQLAIDTGINQGTMGRYVKGENIPEAKNLIKIADYFSVSVDYLLDRTGAPTGVIASDISKSAVVQGINNGPISVNNGVDARALTDEEVELIRIFSRLDVKRRHKILALAFSLDDEILHG